MKKILIFLSIFAGIFFFNPLFATQQQDTVTDNRPVLKEDASPQTAVILPDKRAEKDFSLNALFRGMLGMASLILLGFLLSSDKKNIPWKTVATGLFIQVLLAVGVLYVPFIRYSFEFMGQIFVKILDFTKSGSEFLLGDLMDSKTYGFIFLFQVLPTIIFFSALTSLLFYWGIIQKVVWALAWVFTRALKISGAEALSVAGNIFLGQTESPLMIKPYLEKMSNSEILLVMSGGMATMAGGVLAAYIALLGGDDPQLRLEFAKHLLAASVMAAPAAIVFSKMLVPPTEAISKQIEVSKDKIGSNVLDAITNGTSEGVRLAVNVGAMLLTFIAFIAMFNFVVGKIGQWTSLNDLIAQGTNGRYTELSLQFVLGYTLAPLMWLIGVIPEDIIITGRLLGEKLILTEFIGYISLAELKAAGAFASPKSIIMATYILCGFANFSSIGIQIGGIGALAPGKRVLLSKYGIPALIAGTLTSLMSATIIGMIMG
jgi:CNT family concentrative nucleoside transporter